ncbi:MAG: LysE family transporter [Cyclobacteriaceae bacterium]|nr:LysE family transporter [Cyclobacteriaceae bacterium HetDA_MAG_MS6]
MQILQVFLVAFFISYLGSIPPGTINITTMQMTIQRRGRAALFFAIAASSVELVYAGATVRFQVFLNEQESLNFYFKVVTGLVMLVLGFSNLWSSSTSRTFLIEGDDKGRSGFKRGLALGLLNPLTMPFWLTVTAYLQLHQWISLEGNLFWFYLLGISLGTFSLLLTVRAMGATFMRISDNKFVVHTVPGLVFIALGLYTFIGLF